MTGLVTTERVGGQIEVVTLSRPDRLNAMNADLCTALHEVFERIARDRTCRVVVLTGSGPAFCAGLDPGIRAGPGATGSDKVRDDLASQEHMSRMILRLRGTPQPVVAAVNGAAAGFGLALALASDIRYAASSAVFRVAFINVGASNCDMGTSWLLPRLIGASRAHELMLTGRRVDAVEAERMGLVAEVVDDECLLERALEGASQIAEWAPWATRLTKQGMLSALEMPSEQAALEYEDRQQIMIVQGGGMQEAVAAFLGEAAGELPGLTERVAPDPGLVFEGVRSGRLRDHVAAHPGCATLSRADGGTVRHRTVAA